MDTQSVAESASPRPDRCCQQDPPTGTAFGCVDWFLYDTAARVPVSRITALREGLTPSEERKLMGYVR